jgi:hypothetical protein
MEDSVKLTDTQLRLRLLLAASQRDDRALERPSNLTGGAAGKVVAKLLTEAWSKKSNPAARCRCGAATATLRTRWHSVFRRKAPDHLPRHLLYRMIAYRLQAERLAISTGTPSASSTGSPREALSAGNPLGSKRLCQALAKIDERAGDSGKAGVLDTVLRLRVKRSQCLGGLDMIWQSSYFPAQN